MFGGSWSEAGNTAWTCKHPARSAWGRSGMKLLREKIGVGGTSSYMALAENQQQIIRAAVEPCYWNPVT